MEYLLSLNTSQVRSSTWSCEAVCALHVPSVSLCSEWTDMSFAALYYCTIVTHLNRCFLKLRINAFFVICHIAIAYSMRQIIKPVCVCQSVSVCIRVWTLNGRISWLIFTKIGTDVRTHTRKKRVHWGSISHHPFSHFAPKLPILGQWVQKIPANINNPIYALNVGESWKFSRFWLWENLGRGKRWWRQI